MGNITLTRRFHAVGQGLFCSEMVEDVTSNFKHTVVYDCGTESQDNYLQSEIDDFVKLLGAQPQIDILFLSHLHMDHVSGIYRLMQKCRVRRVVLPRLNPFQIIRVYVTNAKRVTFDGERFGTETFSIIQDVLANRAEHGDSILFDEVPPFIPVPTNHDLWFEFGNGDYRDINTYQDFIRRQFSYSVFSSNGKIIEYIPFNIEDSKSFIFNLVVNRLYPKLVKDLMGGQLDQLNNTDLLEELANLYKCIFGNTNESSMPVLSHILRANSGLDCLYTGDYTYKADKNVAMLREYYKNEWPKIAYIQVPHHGSRYDNPPALYASAHFESIISYGDNNRYDHPHKKAIETIKNGTHKFPIRITQTAQTHIVPLTI